MMREDPLDMEEEDEYDVSTSSVGMGDADGQDGGGDALLRVHSSDIPSVVADEAGSAYIMEENCDVVIRCQHGKHVKAHSLVLAATSPFLSKVVFLFVLLQHSRTVLHITESVVTVMRLFVLNF